MFKQIFERRPRDTSLIVNDQENTKQGIMPLVLRATLGD